MLDMMVDKKVETGKISLRSFCQQMLQNFIKDNADKGVLQNIVNACKYLFDKLQGDVDKDKVLAWETLLKQPTLTLRYISCAGHAREH